MGKWRSLWRCFPLLRLAQTSRRSPVFRLVLAGACAVYLIFLASHPGADGGTGARDDRLRQTRPELPAAPPAPTRPNVVYITLRSKRLKPANIRGTVRPKLRRKERARGAGARGLTRDRPGVLGPDANRTGHAPPGLEYGHVDGFNTSETESGSIRIYSRTPPPWLTPADVQAMRFLAGARVLRASSRAPPSVLELEGETRGPPGLMKQGKGTVHSPVETAEVFAFHLDRVLGLNRTLPAVSRKFSFLHDNQPCPVVLWESTLHPSVQLTWGQYQRSLKLKCWHKNAAPRLDSDCSSIHHHEWSKLALFDFLLQIHRRLDPHCCGFRARAQDECGSSSCSRQENMELEHLTFRKEDPRRLVFTHNRGYFDRNEDSLDFRLLEGIRELPAAAVGVLRGGRLRERLLQSLFIDQTYWESQGGRQGIDTLIDVIERRAKVLLTYINAHGIALAHMNS